MKSRMIQTMGGALTLVIMTGCGGSNQSSTSPTSTTPTTPVLTQLHTMTTIGSTVDVGSGTGHGDQNPYGLYIAPVTAGNITAGDLVVCNFNDANNVQGNGTTIEDLSPTPGATPKRIAQDPSLQGCAALAPNPTSGAIWAAAYTANDNPIFTAAGVLVQTLASAYPWQGPWGQIYASPQAASTSTGSSYGGSSYGYGSTSTASTTTTPSPTSFYVTNAKNGTITQVVTSTSPFTYNTIATGFPFSGVPGSILAPSGLTYDPTSDTLYIVSGASNSVVAFKAVSTIPANGITVTATPTSTPGTMTLAFGGPNASQASVVYSGAPLNGPVSAALLSNGNLVVGDTGDNNMVELDPVHQTMVGVKLVDTGAAGAIFGIATTGTSAATQKIYFNDDNTNTVVAVSQ
jgi:hypothetical protein